MTPDAAMSPGDSAAALSIPGGLMADRGSFGRATPQPPPTPATPAPQPPPVGALTPVPFGGFQDDSPQLLRPAGAEDSGKKKRKKKKEKKPK